MSFLFDGATELVKLEASISIWTVVGPTLSAGRVGRLGPNCSGGLKFKKYI